MELHEKGQGTNFPVYVRVQNLPWSACQKDVRQFFQSLQIPDGNISIFEDEAFIFFDSMGLLKETNLKEYCEINGNKVSLSVIKQKEFRKRIHQRARRTLSFGALENFNAAKKGEYARLPLAKRRKIRPTSMDDGMSFREYLDNDMVFRPDEVDYPNAYFTSYKPLTPPRYRKLVGTRKIHPTLLPKSDNYVSNSLFFCEEEEYGEDSRNSGMKKEKLALEGDL